MKQKLTELFKSKPSAFTAIFCAALVLISYLLYFIAGVLPSKARSYDLTPNGLYTLGDITESIISELDEKVTVYVVNSTEIPNLNSVEGILERYSSLSSKLTVKRVSASELSKYGDLADGSVVVSSDKRSALIEYTDFFDMSPSYYTGNYIYYYYYYQYGYIDCGFYEFIEEYGELLELYDIAFYELRLTTAIDYVTRDESEINTYYALTDHGESSLDELITNELFLSFTEVKYGTLENGIPENVSSVLICDPTSDITEDEYSLLAQYLASGGKLALITSYGYIEDIPLILSLCEEFGMTTDGGYICEDDPDYNLEGYAQFICPDVSEEGYGKYYPSLSSDVLLSNSTGITFSETEGKNQISLITTSEVAYSKQDAENSESADCDEEKDIRGQYSVCAIATDNESGGQIMWFSSASFITEAYDVEASGCNFSIFTASIELLSRSERFDIDSVEIVSDGLSPSDSAFSIFIICVCVLACVIMIACIIVISLRGKVKEPYVSMLGDHENDENADNVDSFEN